MLQQMLEADALSGIMTTTVSFSNLTTMVSTEEAGTVNGNGNDGVSTTEDQGSRKD
jgi:hypothetical protein